MHAAIRTTVLATMLALAAPVSAAPETNAFVVTLGRDTTSVERVTREGARVVVDQVGRAPRVMRRHFEYTYAGANLATFLMRVTPPGDTVATQRVTARVDGDSLRITTRTGATAPRNSSIAFPRGAVVQPSSSPWSVYEQQLMRLVNSKADSLRGTQYFLGADAVAHFTLRKLGRDSIGLTNEHNDVFHIYVDGTGRVLRALPISGTGKFAVARVATLDLDGLASSFAAREHNGAGLGVLSPRDSVIVANAGGASLWIDYGRPGKRGREIFGNVVPYGEVWRTGANAATQFKTDTALSFGGTVIPAGFYTLWTLPSRSGWKLLVNSQTGQWGTEHDATKDIATIDMTVSTLPAEVERFTLSVETSAQGGILHFDWDTTRASAPFTVAP